MEKIVEKVGRAAQFVYDGYLKAVGWIDDHPHLTLWGTTAICLVLLVFG